MSEPRIAPVGLENPPAGAETLFADFMAKRGNVPNLFRTLALRPEIMNGYAAVLNASLNTGTVPVALKEMVAIRVSLINDCEY